jgi:hypothetical protein
MSEIERLRQISSHDLALLGLQDIAYVKAVIVNGVVAWAVHAADGTQVALLPSREAAAQTLVQHEIEPVSVH